VIGKHIELFLVDGTPGGLTTAEIIGWTGHVVRGERVQLGDFISGRNRIATACTSYWVTTTPRRPEPARISDAPRTLLSDCATTLQTRSSGVAS